VNRGCSCCLCNQLLGLLPPGDPAAAWGTGVDILRAAQDIVHVNAARIIVETRNVVVVATLGQDGLEIQVVHCSTSPRHTAAD
jgi:hypothetical protein